MFNQCIYREEIKRMNQNNVQNSLLSIKEYGEITLHLRQVMEHRHINRNQLARSINVRFEVVNKWYSGDIVKLDMDILARICYVLDCDITDLLTYTPSKKIHTLSHVADSGSSEEYDPS